MSIKAIIYCDSKNIGQTPDIDLYHSRFLHSLSLDKRDASPEQEADLQKEHQKYAKSIYRDSLLIAVDGASNILYANMVIPDVVIGDMDSIAGDVLSYYRTRANVEIFPARKDETDTELALNWCATNNIDDVLIINTLEGDFAHTIGNVMLLFKARELGIRARIFNFRELAFLVPAEWCYSGRGKRKISLIPISAVVSGVETSGLTYPLRNEDLFRHSTRGLSNVFVDGEIKICYKYGDLLGVLESDMEDLLWIKI